MSSKYTDSYASRNSGDDMADKAMLKYLKDTGSVEYKDYLRIGTDPKVNKLDLFWYATEILLLPDYIVVRDELIYFVEVKGTNKVKASIILGSSIISLIFSFLNFKKGCPSINSSALTNLLLQ